MLINTLAVGPQLWDSSGGGRQGVTLLLTTGWQQRRLSLSCDAGLPHTLTESPVQLNLSRTEVMRGAEDIAASLDLIIDQFAAYRERWSIIPYRDRETDR